MTKNLSLLLLICACTFNANGQAGSLDHTFGNNGIVTTNFLDTANTLSEEGHAVLIGTNGNIFVVARLSPNSSYTRIVKYLPGGRLDSSYGKGGYSTTSNLVATSAVIQEDKIIVTGAFQNSGIPDNIAFARYTPDGALDTSFGNNGIVKTNFYSYQANAMVLQGNKIIVGGLGNNYQFFLARFMANGSPDSSFGENGKLTTDFNSSNSFISAIVLQKDKILVAGGAQNAVTYNYDFALARYTADGSLDSSFGENGKVTTDFNSSDDQATSIALQGDKILVAGFGDVTVDFALARYTADGKLDLSFGENGKVTNNFNNSYYNYAYSITLQGDKILLAGETLGNFALARYTADGALDSTFGENGEVITDFNGNEDHGNSLALQGDKIIVVGYTIYYINGAPADFAVIRYNADGSLDPSFGKNGIIAGHFPRTQVYFTNTTIQGNKVIAAGYSGVSYSINAFALARYTADGSLDSSFGVNGRVKTNFDNSDQKANSVVLQGDKIIVGGYTGFFQFQDFMLARYTGEGKLDSSFGVNGRIITDFNNGYGQISAIAMQGDKILVTGFAYSQENGTDFAVARYTADGKLDSAFGVNGKVTTDFYGSYDNANLLTLQGDKIIVAGYTGAGSRDFALARYTADGVPDATFGADGKVTTSINSYSDDVATSIALEGDKIILAGTSVDLFQNSTFVLVRYTADGMLDVSFGVNGIVTTDFVSSYGHTNPLAVQGDKIILGGNVGNSDFSFNRYAANGSLDSSFGKNGKVTTNLTGPFALGEIAIHENRLYAVGSLSFGPDESYGVVAAYQLQASVMLSCPGDKTLRAADGICTAVVNGIDPVLSPVSNFALVNYTLSGATVCSGKGTACGKTFNLGTTLVTYSLAADPQKTCSFNVTIEPAKEQCNGKDDNCDGQVDEGCPCLPSITFNNVAVYESEGEATITVTLSKKTNKPVFIMYYTEDGTAKSKKRRELHFFDHSSDSQQDYISTAGILNVPAGVQTAVIKVPVINDGVAEMDEYFHVRLLYAFNADIANHEDIITIKDGVPLVPGLMNNKVHKNVFAEELYSVPLNIKAYPNPSETGFTIQLQGGNYKQQLSVQVYDINGRLIEQRKNMAVGKNIWLGDHYKTGTYIIEAVQGKEKVSTKVTKVNK